MIDEALDIVAMVTLFAALLAALLIATGIVNISLDNLAKDFNNFVKAVMRVAR